MMRTMPHTVTHTQRLIPLLFAALIPLAATAAEPGRHPAYLHALSDLRAARSLIEHRPGDAKVTADENRAIAQIDATINDIRKAAIDDGKNLNDHPPVDQRVDRIGPLHDAAELLNKAHSDIAREEDDATTRGLRDRAIRHIDAAISATHQAIQDAEKHR